MLHVIFHEPLHVPRRFTPVRYSGPFHSPSRLAFRVLILERSQSSIILLTFYSRRAIELLMPRRPDYPTNSLSFQLDGKNYVLSKEDVCAKVAFAVPKPTDKYFVAIDGRPYPPKQLLELALRVPSANFTTAAANAILRRLGFEVQTTSEVQARTRTESERLFEAYLWASGYLEFDFEPALSDSAARPDFLLRREINGATESILFEVKEFQPTAADFHLGGGSYDPYAAIREKIQAGRKKFQEHKAHPCALVLYNAGKPLVDLRWEFIYGAMLGNLGYSMPFDPLAGRLVDKPVLRPVFTNGGEMHREKGGEIIQPQNTTISAIVVLELLLVGKKRLEIEAAKGARELNRELKYTEYLDLVESSKGTERDISLRQLRTVTCLNPYRRIPFPQDLFRGPYDECYGEISGDLQRMYVGDQLKSIEAAEREVGIRQHMILPKDASRE